MHQVNSLLIVHFVNQWSILFDQTCEAKCSPVFLHQAKFPSVARGAASAKKCWVSCVGGRKKKVKYSSQNLPLVLADDVLHSTCAAKHCWVRQPQLCTAAHMEGGCLLSEGIVHQRYVHTAGLGCVYDVSFLY